MTDPTDEKTQNLPFEPENLDDADRVFKKIKDADTEEREKKETDLRDRYDLVRVKSPVFVEDQALAKERRAKALAAARSAEYREKKKAESGLILSMTPVDVVAKVKESGGWPQWLASQAITKEPEKPVVKRTPEQIEAYAISKKILKLGKFQRKMLSILFGI